MQLKELEVNNTRNITKILFYPNKELTVIAGYNAQGKTSLLESIFLLTGSKSFKNAKDKELVKHGEKTAVIIGKTEVSGRENKIEITVENGETGKNGRYAKINDVEYGKANEIAGIFTAVVFEPNHLGLIKNGPDGRRRFLDAALCQLYPGYVSMLRRFGRALSQKNALLRAYHKTADADGILDAFDASLASTGAEIICRRSNYLELAAPAAENFYNELSCGAEQLKIKYSPCTSPQNLAQKYKQQRSADIRAGFSTFGPQREDFDLIISGQSARTYGSQGQQRSAALALKLAEAEVAGIICKQPPVLLLDDVLSELDEKRQGYLLSRMKGRQSFVTCCDASVFKRTAGQIIKITAGKIINN